MPDVDTIFVARFIANNVIVSNKLLGYTEDENNQITITYSDVNVTSTATPSISDSTITYTMPANNTYIFAGWWDSINNERDLVSGETISYTCSLEAPVSTKYIYALWIDPEIMPISRNPEENGLSITKSFDIVTNGLTLTAVTNNADYNWTGWYSGANQVESGAELTLTYAQTFERLVTMNSFSGMNTSYEARWSMSGIVVQVSETPNNGQGTVSKTDNGNDTWTITATPATGYDFAYWTHNGLQYSTNATETVANNSGAYYAYFTAKTDIDYAINTKLQNYADDYYTSIPTVEHDGVSGESVYISAPAAQTGYELTDVKVNGVTATPVASGTNAGKYELPILGDGSSYIDFYFNLKIIDLTYHYNDGTASSTVTEKYNTSTSSYALQSIANVTWYSDINLTTQVTILDVNATNIHLYACYNGNNNLSTKFDLTEMTGYYKVGIKDGSFTSSTDIVIPNYVGDVIVKTVVIDNLYGEQYNSISMPSGLELIEYGTYSWIILNESGGNYTLLSENVIGSRIEYDATGTAEDYNGSSIKTVVEGLVTTYGTDSISLLDEATYGTYNTIIDSHNINKKWWLKDSIIFDDALWASYIKESGSLDSCYEFGEDATEELYIRPLLTITL